MSTISDLIARIEHTNLKFASLAFSFASQRLDVGHSVTSMAVLCPSGGELGRAKIGSILISSCNAGQPWSRTSWISGEYDEGSPFTFWLPTQLPLDGDTDGNIALVSCSSVKKEIFIFSGTNARVLDSDRIRLRWTKARRIEGRPFGLHGHA